MGGFNQNKKKSVPIGSNYIQYPTSTGFTSRCPGDVLKDYNGNILTTANYATFALAAPADFTVMLNNCAFPGTTWKMAINSAYTMRQVGQKLDANGKTIGTTVIGTTQDHQMQGHWHIFYNDVAGGPNNAPSNVPASPTTPSGATVIRYPIEDTYNAYGTPLVGVETRMANTTVIFWVRVA